jgi:hypothetical protein
MRNVDTIAIGLATALSVLVFSASAHAQGGVPAPDFTEPCPAVYPGDTAGQERIARWMARSAADRGLPRELPVMAGLVESGLRNLSGRTYRGFFGMHRSLNSGDYRGFPRNPTLQVKWFLDTADQVRQRRVAEGRADPAGDPSSWGEWIADVERPAREFRGRYQTRLEEARTLIAGKCAAPASADVTPPRLFVRIAAMQHPLATGGIQLSVRCPDHDCLVGATATFGTRTVRTRAIEPSARAFTTLSVAVPRAVRRELRAGHKVRTTVTAIAADIAANANARHRLVTLEG